MRHSIFFKFIFFLFWVIRFQRPRLHSFATLRNSTKFFRTSKICFRHSMLIVIALLMISDSDLEGKTLFSIFHSSPSPLSSSFSIFTITFYLSLCGIQSFLNLSFFYFGRFAFSDHACIPPLRCGTQPNFFVPQKFVFAIRC